MDPWAILKSLCMLNRMKFGNRNTDIILYYCCWGFARYYESGDLYLPYKVQTCQNHLPVPQVLESLKALFKKGVNQRFSSSSVMLTLSISMWHFRNSCCVTQSWSILVFIQENWFHSFCSVAEDIPLFSFPVPTALSTTLKVLITHTKLNNLISGRKEQCLQVLCLLMLPVHLFFRAKAEPGTSVSQILVLLFCSKSEVSLWATLCWLYGVIYCINHQKIKQCFRTTAYVLEAHFLDTKIFRIPKSSLVAHY